MAKKKIDISATIAAMDGFTQMSADKFANDKKANQIEPETIKPFAKPNSDYYKLDLVVRNTVMNPKTKHAVTVESVKVDYREYINSVRGDKSITRYIQDLIEKDMKKHTTK